MQTPLPLPRPGAGTLADTVIARRGRSAPARTGLGAATRSALLVVGFSLLVALSAQIAIPLPFTPVPLTAQTLAVLLTGAVLGWRRGALALLAYWAEGLAGLPVFSGGASAWTTSMTLPIPWLLGPSAGYAAGFIPAAALVGWLAERRWDRSVPLTVAAMVLGNVVIYACGLLDLARFVPAPHLFQLGVLPFLPGDAIKIAIAALVLPGAWALLGRERRA